MHVDFDPQQVDWNFCCVPFSGADEHILHDAAGAAATMMGMGITPSYGVFSGQPFQRGTGIGSVLRSLWRVLLPIGRQIGSAIGRQGMESGARVLSGIVEGQGLKETLEKEGRVGLKSLLDKASENLGKQKGSGGNFDFKHYKRNMKKAAMPATCIADANSEEQNGIKRRLLATIGPSTKGSFPSNIKSPVRNKRAAKNSSARKKKIRVDALGIY